MGPTIIGFLQMSSRHNRPKQIAWAIVWGCICGLMPKSSLLFYMVAGASILMPMHLVVAAIALIVTSVCGPVVQPLFGNLGHWMLSSTGIVGPIRNLDKLPLIPWLNLHNTVLLGAITSCVVAVWPAYWSISSVVTYLYRKWLPLYEEDHLANQVQSIAIKTRVESNDENSVKSIGLSTTAQSPLYDQVVTAKSSMTRPAIVAPEVEPQPLAAALDRFDESMSSFTDSQRRGSSQQVASSLSNVIDSIHALEDLLEKAHAEADQPIDARAVLARATEASELVDDILATMDAETNVVPVPIEDVDASLMTLDSSSPNQMRLDSPQVFHAHDTKISIYRRARTGELTVTGSDNKTQSEKDSMPTATDAADQQSNLAVANTASKGVLNRTNSAGQSSESNTIRKHDNQQHEEALRHLLNHLRALKEKV